VVAIAHGTARPVLSSDPVFRAAIARGADFSTVCCARTTPFMA
jgi:hypothetical protein